MSIIGKVGIVGDIHLNSKNYGAHNNYPEESLYCFKKITDITRSECLTHLIGCGDFSYGRFHSLEYRIVIEKELKEQFEITKGNRYELKGNHDSAGYGMTERDYYIQNGLLKPSCNISIGNLNLSMVDYEGDSSSVNIVDDTRYYNFIVAHDFYKFENTRVSNFGAANILDSKEEWFGLDCLICGHVHKIMEFEGYICRGDMVHKLKVYYPGCMTRPSYRENHLDDKGQMIIITVYDDGNIEVDKIEVPLWSIEESFNISVKEDKKRKKDLKESRVDISEVVKQLDSHDRNVGNPEDIIKDLKDIPDKYKNKAIDLLKMALG